MFGFALVLAWVFALMFVFALFGAVFLARLALCVVVVGAILIIAGCDIEADVRAAHQTRCNAALHTIEIYEACQMSEYCYLNDHDERVLLAARINNLKYCPQESSNE